MSVAVIRLGGKQYTVEPGKIIDVHRLSYEAGQTFETEDLLSGQKVEAKVIELFKGDKIRGVKFKNKVRYTRTFGQRPHLSKVEIVKIG